MRYWAIALLVLLAFLLQTTLAVHIAVGAVAPDLLLGLAISLGLLFGWQMGGAAGLAGGMLLDLAFGRYVGLHGLALGFTGLLAGLMESSVVKDNVFLPAAAGLAGNLIARTVSVAVLLLLRKPVFPAFAATLLVSSLYNTVICALIYPLLLRNYHYLHPSAAARVSGTWV